MSDCGVVDMHHCDGSPRWSGGPASLPLDVWQAMVRDHMRGCRASARRTAVPPSGWPVWPKALGGRFRVL